MTSLFQKVCETGKWPETVPDRMRVQNGRNQWWEVVVIHPIHKETLLVQMIPSQTDGLARAKMLKLFSPTLYLFTTLDLHVKPPGSM